MIMEITNAMRERMQGHLLRDLTDLVEIGELTSDEANEWYVDKCDQWAAQVE